MKACGHRVILKKSKVEETNSGIVVYEQKEREILKWEIVSVWKDVTGEDFVVGAIAYYSKFNFDKVKEEWDSVYYSGSANNILALD